MENPYQPIPCNFHDRLLDWATRRDKVQATLLQEGQEVEVNAVIVDVFTQAGAEFMQFDNGQQFRLDALIQVNGLPVREDYCPT